MASGKKLSVFLIDDNEMTRAMLRVIIQGDDFEVVGEALNGMSGLERARKLRPDIICLDVVLPDIDGLELLREFKIVLPDSLVLMVTANRDAQSVQTAISRGASGFIVKPFTPGTVLDTLNDVAVKVRKLHAARE